MTNPESHLAPESWAIGALVADGALGPVLRCESADGRVGILKGVRPDAGSAGQARLRREADLLGRLDHPALPRLLDRGEGPTGPWLVMAVAPGRDLRTLWTSPPIRWELAVHVARQVAEAVAYLHARGIVHRDVKPANVRVEDGRVTLLDLGSATELAAGPITAGLAPGTPRYAPPEWFDRAADDPRAADVYAVGQILHELLQGGPAFPGDEDLAGRKAVPLEPGSVPAPVASLVRWLTAPDPDARPTAAAASEALVTLDGGSGTLPEATAAASAGGSLSHGERLGRYELVEVVGRGAMGVVHRARDPELGREVAVKVLRDGAGLARFRREARALARLDHPTFVRVLDVGAADGVSFFVMELVLGLDLARWLAERGRPPRQQALGWLAAVADALDAAHRAGLVHRDIKPSNLMVTEDATIRVLDLGIVAEIAERDAPVASGGPIRVPGTAPLGTPSYMAPEQERPGRVGPEADVYALGVVLHEVLAGRRPAGSVVDPTLPPRLRRLIRAMLHPDPARRPSARRVATTLVRATRPVARTAAGGLGLVAIVLLGLLATLALRHVQDQRREAQAASRWHQVRNRIEVLRAEGQDEQAEAQFQTFVTFPGHRGTRAVVEAWQAKAAERRSSGDAAGARDALGRAWSLAEEPATQRRALLALAEVASNETAFAYTVDALAALVPHDPAVERLRRRVERSFRIASPDRRGNAVDRLLRGTPLPGPGRLWTRLDFDGDGIDDLLAVGSDGLVAYPRGDARAPGRRLADLPEGGPFGLRGFSVPGLGPHLLLDRQIEGARFENRIVAVTPEGIVPVVEPWLGAGVTAVAALETPRGPLVLLGLTAYDRDLVAFSPAEGWRRWNPHPPTTAADSEVREVRLVDLDGAGDPEIVVGTGPWDGWDLRVLRLAPGGGLELVRRRSVGEVNLAVSVNTPRGRRLAVALTQEYSPPALRATRDNALAWFRWDGGELVLEETLPVPRPRYWLFTGDFDGDDLDEIVFRYEAMEIVGFTAEGAVERQSVQRLLPRAVIDVDGDGRDELVARELESGRDWMLGLGETPLPTVPRDPVISPPVPSELPEDLHEAWQRAETLHRVGVSGLAAERFLEIAQLESGPAHVHAMRRAGQLFEAVERWDDAIAAYEAIADVDPPDLPALEALVSLTEREVRLDDAARWAAVRRDASVGAQRAGWAERAARLAGLADRPELVVRGLGDLGTWTIHRPLELGRALGSDGVRIRSARPGILAELPVDWDGGPFSASFDLQLDRLEWGSLIGIRLEGRDPAGLRDPVQIDSKVLGSGGRSHAAVQGRCTRPGLDGTYDDLPLPPPPLPDATVTRRLAMWPGRTQICRPDDASQPPADLDPSGLDWVLQLVDDRYGQWGASLADVVLRDLVVRGLSPREARPPETTALERALALAEEQLAEGDVDAASATVRGALARTPREEIEALAPVWLRTTPADWLPLVRDRLGPGRWPIVLWDQLSAAIEIHPHAIDELLRTQLQPLTPLTGESAARTEARAELLLARAASWLRSDRIPATTRDLLAARAAVERLGGGSDLASRLREFEARLAVVRDEPEVAIETLLRALRESPAPGPVADRFARDPTFAALRDEPRWAELERWRTQGRPR